MAIDQSASDLGARLRRVRTAAGYTLDWTAERADLTKGYLSKIERGQATPSIAVINRLSAVLGVSLSEFFMPEGERKAITLLRAGERRAINRSGTELGYRYEVGDFSKANAQSDFYFLTLPRLEPGESPPRFVHDGEEIILMLEGQMLFDFAGMEMLLNAGDCIQFDASMAHCGQAVGEGEAKAFVVVIPNKSQRETPPG